ncbi:MAG TPA: response regulator [Methylomusa anaerophila]|uniref:Response regulator rcp1 n=1 Tax=Methylomusa anaerophila TaxID=1930071 RepID=A0A348ALS4_9FIRM|nr:response regulator [Methylomusa anaerophila]BBB92022.1 response regulator rcp1 [Methylomusa anaerophila]HML87967.1 response regulator [Methylomusa anaerophila]
MEPIKILLVEDDPGHARLIERNLRRAGIANEIIFIDNGQSALDYLNTPCATGMYECLLILLDLNLPVLDGYQVLERIKSGERTKKIPVIILTTTDVPQEVDRCYELGCNIFITKPVQYDDFCTAVSNLGLLLSIVKIP